MALHHELSVLVLCSLLATLTAPCAAQDETAVPPAQAAAGQPASNGPALSSLDRLLNTAVYAAESAGDGERAADGAATEASSQRQNVGVVSNLVIDTLAQRLTFAVVHTAEGARAVPIGTLAWDPASHGWLLSGGKAALDKARTFEAQRLDELHQGAGEVPVGKDEASATNEAQSQLQDRSRDHVAGTPLETNSPLSGRYLLATDCARRDVMADDGRFAPAIGLVVETRSGVPAFLRLAASGGDIAVPWAALRVRKPTSPAEKEAFAVAMTKARLETVPRLGKESSATLDSRPFRDKLYEFFGVVTPTFEEPLGAARNQ